MLIEQIITVANIRTMLNIERQQDAFGIMQSLSHTKFIIGYEYAHASNGTQTGAGKAKIFMGAGLDSAWQLKENYCFPETASIADARVKMKQEISPYRIVQKC